MAHPHPPSPVSPYDGSSLPCTGQDRQEPSSAYYDGGGPPQPLRDPSNGGGGDGGGNAPTDNIAWSSEDFPRRQDAHVLPRDAESFHNRELFKASAKESWFWKRVMALAGIIGGAVVLGLLLLLGVVLFARSDCASQAGATAAAVTQTVTVISHGGCHGPVTAVPRVKARVPFAAPVPTSTVNVEW